VHFGIKVRDSIEEANGLETVFQLYSCTGRGTNAAQWGDRQSRATQRVGVAAAQQIRKLMLCDFCCLTLSEPRYSRKSIIVPAKPHEVIGEK
jgi:hypothetical protein